MDSTGEESKHQDWPLYDPDFQDTHEFDDSHGAPSQAACADSKDILDDITLVGLSRDNPLRLLVPFCLSAGQTIWIASPYVVELYNPYEMMKIYCQDPIKLQCDDTICLAPRAPLLSSFARGWEKLSNELKVNVLKFNLTWNTSITYSKYKTYLDVLLHHLRMTPEIATISRDLFYSKNEFEFDVHHLDGCDDAYWESIPFALIHRVCLKVDLDMNFSEEITPLDMVLDRLVNVRHVILKLRWQSWRFLQLQVNEEDESSWIGATKSILGDKQYFVASEGYIIFSRISRARFRGGTNPIAIPINEMENLVKSRVTFEPKAQ